MDNADDNLLKVNCNTSDYDWPNRNITCSDWLDNNNETGFETSFVRQVLPTLCGQHPTRNNYCSQVQTI